MKSNRLALSILKTSFVLFHSKKLKLCKSLNLKIVGLNIQEASYYVNVDILIMLFYSLIYPFLTLLIQAWGLTYPTYLKPVNESSE